jgi:Flp pilus assembly protein TadB
MNDFQIPISVAAIAAGLYAGWLVWVLVVRGRVTANRDAALTEQLLHAADRNALPPSRIEDQLAAAGLSFTAATFNLIRLAGLATGLLIALAFRLPTLIWIAAALAGWFASLVWLGQRKKARELSMDDDLPAALSGLAASLALSQDLSEALQSAADTVSAPG